jgi:hypothetical protein
LYPGINCTPLSVASKWVYSLSLSLSLSDLWCRSMLICRECPLQPGKACAFGELPQLPLSVSLISRFPGVRLSMVMYSCRRGTWLCVASHLQDALNDKQNELTLSFMVVRCCFDPVVEDPLYDDALCILKQWCYLEFMQQNEIR